MTLSKSVLILCCASFVACTSTSPRHHEQRANATTGSMVGDFDDIDAAVRVAATKAEVAVVSSRALSQDAIEYELVTLTGEPGRLRVERRNDNLQAECSIGRFGDPERENRLLEALRSRLRDLYGVEWAPQW